MFCSYVSYPPRSGHYIASVALKLGLCSVLCSTRTFLLHHASIAPVSFDPEDAGREDIWSRPDPDAEEGGGTNTARGKRTHRVKRLEEDPKYKGRKTTRRALDEWATGGSWHGSLCSQGDATLPMSTLFFPHTCMIPTCLLLWFANMVLLLLLLRRVISPVLAFSRPW